MTEAPQISSSSSSSSSSSTNSVVVVRFATEAKNDQTNGKDDCETIDLYELKSLHGIPMKPTISKYASNHFNRTLKRLADDSMEMSFPDDYEVSLAKRERVVYNQMMSLKDILTTEYDSQRNELVSEDSIIQAATDYIQSLEDANKNMDQRIRRLQAIGGSNGNSIEDGSSPVDCSASVDGLTTVASSCTGADDVISVNSNSNMQDYGPARFIDFPTDRSLALALVNLDASLIYCNELFCHCAAWKYPTPSGISILPLVHSEDQPILLSRLQAFKSRHITNFTPCPDLASDSVSESSDQSASTSSGSSRWSRQDVSEIVVRATLPCDSVVAPSNDKYLMALLHKKRHSKFLITAHFSEDGEDVPDRLSVTVLFDDL
eukprot:scaffold4358_cov177-Ochromonas_danica.AAC.28